MAKEIAGQDANLAKFVQKQVYSFKHRRFAESVSQRERGGNTASANRTGENALFVYGTLVYAGMRRRLLGRQVEARPAELVGFERGRRKHFYVLRHAGAVVRGKLVFGLGESDFRILDEYEEVPRLYRRERVEAVDGNGRVRPCWVYLPTAWARR